MCVPVLVPLCDGCATDSETLELYVADMIPDTVAHVRACYVSNTSACACYVSNASACACTCAGRVGCYLDVATTTTWEIRRRLHLLLGRPVPPQACVAFQGDARIGHQDSIALRVPSGHPPPGSAWPHGAARAFIEHVPRSVL